MSDKVCYVDLPDHRVYFNPYDQGDEYPGRDNPYDGHTFKNGGTEAFSATYCSLCAEQEAWGEAQYTPADLPSFEPDRQEAPVKVEPAGKDRKNMPVTTGVLDYFPDAIREISKLSKFGNDKHNPGEPLHWSREKSMDHADCIGRHLLERGTVDPETGDLKLSHSVALAWRALALLQVELDEKKSRA